MTKMPDLDALEAVARAATPGPWEYRHESPSMNGENCTIRQSGVPGIRMSAHVYGFGTGMIEHIATFDPPTVLALITRLRDAESRLREAEAVIEEVDDLVARHHLDTTAGRAVFKITGNYYKATNHGGKA